MKLPKFVSRFFGGDDVEIPKESEGGNVSPQRVVVVHQGDGTLPTRISSFLDEFRARLGVTTAVEVMPCSRVVDGEVELFMFPHEQTSQDGNASLWLFRYPAGRETRQKVVDAFTSVAKQYADSSTPEASLQFATASMRVR